MKKIAFVLSSMMLLGTVSYAQMMPRIVNKITSLESSRITSQAIRRSLRGLDHKVVGSVKNVKSPKPPVSSTKVPTAPSSVPSTVNAPREIPALPVSRSLAVSRPNSPDIVNETSVKSGKAKEEALAAAVADFPLLFDSQADLARYVHKYYVDKGEPGQRLEMDNGKVFIRYDVPHEIGYLPPGYKQIEIIENENYFIIYEENTQTGQLVQRLPMLDEFFTKLHFH